MTKAQSRAQTAVRALETFIQGCTYTPILDDITKLIGKWTAPGFVKARKKRDRRLAEKKIRQAEFAQRKAEADLQYKETLRQQTEKRDKERADLIERILVIEKRLAGTPPWPEFRKLVLWDGTALQFEGGYGLHPLTEETNFAMENILCEIEGVL